MNGVLDRTANVRLVCQGISSRLPQWNAGEGNGLKSVADFEHKCSYEKIFANTNWWEYFMPNQSPNKLGLWCVYRGCKSKHSL